MRANTSFTLGVDDIKIIEDALFHHMGRLTERRATHVESTVKAESELESVKFIDNEIKNIYDLLGRIHNQKVWYRPKNETYVSG